MARNIPTIVFVSALAFFPGCSDKEEAAEEPAPPVTPTKVEPINFGSATFGSVSDIDGNTYKTVVIGTATWMAENLKTTKFKNGDAISKLPDGSEWLIASTPGYHNYNDHEGLISVYGHLYNCYVRIDPRGVCPSGWHAATPEDWNAIGVALGGAAAAGGRMKEQGTAHWVTSNNSDNQSGFTGVPGGSMYKGRVTDMGTDGYWWSTAEGDFFYLTNVEVNLRHKSTAVMNEGLSIRCVKD
jgi:uncharacterized protein (TIGR02145 family)